jgi:hypothetical protein
MKEVMRYEADDGREFETKEDCLKHERLLYFAEQYRENEIPTRGYYSVDWNLFLSWVKEHKTLMKDILEVF